MNQEYLSSYLCSTQLPPTKKPPLGKLSNSGLEMDDFYPITFFSGQEKLFQVSSGKQNRLIVSEARERRDVTGDLGGNYVQ